jgi:hypothetical protein
MVDLVIYLSNRADAILEKGVIVTIFTIFNELGLSPLNAHQRSHALV